MSRLRSTRGWPAVAQALQLEGACDADAIVQRCRTMAPEVRVNVAKEPSKARPAARGRYLAGEVTLFPRAFEDARTLAHTLLHELAHAQGQSEEEAEAFAIAMLSCPGGSP